MKRIFCFGLVLFTLLSACDTLDANPTAITPAQRLETFTQAHGISTAPTSDSLAIGNQIFQTATASRTDGERRTTLVSLELADDYGVYIVEHDRHTDALALLAGLEKDSSSHVRTLDASDDLIATQGLFGYGLPQAFIKLLIYYLEKLFGNAQETQTPQTPQQFTVYIENIASDAVIPSSTAVLTPGVWVVHKRTERPIFSSNRPDRGEGLKPLAEDGNPAALGDSLAANFANSGVFAQPDGATENGPLLPGNTYSFSIEAHPNDYFSFATMLVQTNDGFYAPTEDTGIRLFDNAGHPINQTVNVRLWDAGTEANQALGQGSNQPQGGPSIAETPDNPATVRTHPQATQLGGPVIRVTITPQGE